VDVFLLPPRDQGEIILVELSAAVGGAAPLVGIFTPFARHPVVWAQEVAPGLWRAEFQVPASYAGRALSVRVTPAPGTALPLGYTLDAL